MNRTRGTCPIILAVLALTVVGEASAQRMEHRRITALITYVSSGSFYFDAGRSRGLATGDTVAVSRLKEPRAVGVILAVSSSSSSAAVVAQSGPLAIGDSVVVVKDVAVVDSSTTAAAVARSLELSSSLTGPNRVSGRFALQYGASGVFGKALDFSQPAALLRLEVARLWGTNATLTVYGRTNYDMTQHFTVYRTGPRLKTRLYELSLVSDDAKMPYGWGVGRITSRFVGGLGSFDGGQFFMRKGNLSGGVLAGAQADYTTSSIDTDQLKFAAFVNYAWGGDVFRTSDVTLAYGQQRYKGKMDRAFMYLQGSLRFGSDLFFYSSTEMDFYEVNNGVRTKDLHLTNTFVTLSYTPVMWLNVNAGYDAARMLYLVESMKSIPDTLFDKTLKEGYRASVSFRLPLNMTVGAQTNFRLASGTTSSARTLGTTFRISDILESEVNFGVQYANIRGLYTEGNDLTLDLDRWVARSLSVSFRVDRYHYVIQGQALKLVTTTAGGSVNYRVSRSLYALVNFDQVWDTTRDTQRLYLEVGVHF